MAAFLQVLKRVQEFFSSWRFPVLALAVLGSFEVLLLVLLFVPGGDAGFGAFADEFRKWCFGYDERTGSLQWAYVGLMLGHPPVIGGIIALFWKEPVAELLRTRPRALLPYGAGAAVIATGMTLSLFAAAKPGPDPKLPLPAAALRTAYAAPSFDLRNQHGQRVTLEQLEGQVVILTGVYATCGYTCPLILAQLERTLARLRADERRWVRVVAITLDPERDTERVLLELANRHKMSAPEAQFLTGPPERVNALLDALQISRKMDMTTGAIDHANLFIVLDKRGKLAYRFTLSQRQEHWLLEAVQLLAREPGSG